MLAEFNSVQASGLYVRDQPGGQFNGYLSSVDK